MWFWLSLIALLCWSGEEQKKAVSFTEGEIFVTAG